MAFSKLSLVIAILIIAVTVGAFALVRLGGFYLADNVYHNTHPNQVNVSASSSEDRILFTEMLLFDGKTVDGFPFTTQTYRSWDCVILKRRIELLRSGEQATLKFKKELGKAEELIDRGLRVDARGQPVGERAVVRFPKDGDSPQIRILWTDDSNVLSIESPSLDHALKLEAWLKSGQSRRASRPEGVSKDFVFEAATSTSGITRKGIPFSESLFRSKECVVVSSRIEYFDSVVKAQTELSLRVKDATEIVEKGSPAALENRTVAIFAPELPEEFSHSAQVLWTHNGELHTIKSNSLAHTLSFERQRK